MTKRVLKTFSIVLFTMIFFFSMNSINAKTLGEMKADLATAKANLADNQAKRKAAQAKIKQYNSEIQASAAKIEQYEADIETSRDKIIELEIEIKEKGAEIEDLLRFLQESNGENIYLEYVFGATDFADLMYRSTVVEQLSTYNDKLIDEMYTMIEENKQLQIELANKITISEKEIESFKSKLSSLNVTVDDLDEHQKDISAEIKATEEEVKYYEDYGCKNDQEISNCLNVPYATGFARPTDFGRVSSNYGYRNIWGGTSFHNGIDIALSEGNKVYASAAGYVSKVVHRANCGGNMVYINHNISGVKYTTVYMHLISYDVRVGDIVSIVTLIGKSGGGATTQSYDDCTTGAHLHFGVLKGWETSSSYSKDPRNYINFPAKGNSYYSRWG